MNERRESVLYLRVRKLADGRFRVSYYWSVWEFTNREYFKTEEEASEFIAELIKNTRWRYSK
jgi:hypothetical protein